MARGRRRVNPIETVAQDPEIIKESVKISVDPQMDRYEESKADLKEVLEINNKNEQEDNRYSCGCPKVAITKYRMKEKCIKHGVR